MNDLSEKGAAQMPLISNSIRVPKKQHSQREKTHV